MENLEPELVVAEPRGARVSQQLLDLGADVEREGAARVVGLDDVQIDDDARDAFDQALEPLVVRCRVVSGSHSM